MSALHKRFLAVAAAGAAGYFTVDRVYRYARKRWGPQDGSSKADWVCPGVGVAGAVLGASAAGYALCGSGAPAPTSCPVMTSLSKEPYPGKLDLPGFTLSTD